MRYRKLGNSALEVSELGLGSMTWGEQNTEAEAHAQLDYAVAHGINFIDTAEMYPVPPRQETQGLTETYIGSWLHRNGNRDRVTVATKVCGLSTWMSYLRDGKPRLDRVNIEAAIDASLQRLHTDYVDLYQLHWPDRDSNYFGQLGFYPGDDSEATPVEETLEVLADLIEAGKIRYYGVSNETAWGLMHWLQIADSRALPRPISIQNPYSLLNRTFEIGLAEACHHENIGLLPYSPLGFGVLTGKYLDDQPPVGSRLQLFGSRYQRYSSEAGREATAAYVALARDNGLDPAQMALAFLRTRPWVASVLIGATRMDQLETNIDSADIVLENPILKGIEAIQQRHPNPCP
jgi:aryl-alcohol dehydrogenase-like predicted oxidoreductase